MNGPIPDGGDRQKLASSGHYNGERLKIREAKLLQTVLKNHQKVQAGPADNPIHNGNKVDQGNAPTVAKELKSVGMEFVNSDKSPGSHVTSAELIFYRLHTTKTQFPTKPHIYFSSPVGLLSKLCHSCSVTIISLMQLERGLMTMLWTPWLTG
ncbi:hypothetical protein [Pseudomonas fluorescens]|uniref:hypothetical protein n=1 Tax=Pseudomonas fluorescens TaxID=294 RepID=UPI00125107D7|nr:hypothetical protein [Pseudomonas fluorescens]VVO77543.1 hypothetical protein PS898_01635 [Pseudomonas fluorescens]